VRNQRRIIFAVAITLLVVVGSLIDLDRLPSPWWDEGWTIDVARNWAEYGHYGHYLSGEPTAPDLAAAFPTVASVALSFKLFGVGIWQARVAIVIYAILALAMLYWLAVRLYDRTVAQVSIVLLVVLAPYPFLNPVYVGRQVLAEMPMLFFLLAGYATFWLSLKRSRWWLAMALITWAVALVTKAQVLPFWAASLAVPLMVMLFQRRWKWVGLLTFMLIGSYATSQLLIELEDLILRGHTVNSPSIPGLYEVTAFVINVSARLDAGLRVLLMGLPTLAGLIYAAAKSWRGVKSGFGQLHQDLLRMMLLSLAGTWFAWYAFLSLGLERYLFPAVFVGSIFTAAALTDVAGHFSESQSLARLRADARRRTPGRYTLFLAVLTGALAFTLPQIALTLRSGFVTAYGSPLAEVSDFLNNHTPTEALIESYDSELFFLLERHYHYPPNDLSITSITRTLLKQNVSNVYDPLVANPDYLVVGSFIHNWHIYDDIVASGQFTLVYHNSRYEVYKRVR
jgi:4-amino-4-deoxy-L-arabinose transferase-like glycosyltransferase